MRMLSPKTTMPRTIPATGSAEVMPRREVCSGAMLKGALHEPQPWTANSCNVCGGAGDRMEPVLSLEAWRTCPWLVPDTSGHVMLAYAQLTIMVDGRAVPEPKRTVLWHGPGPGTDQDCSDISQPVPELLTRFGSDGWELVALQDHREGGMRTSYWDRGCSVATYTFKRPVPSSG
jgi:hypothetical protein